MPNGDNANRDNFGRGFDFRFLAHHLHRHPKPWDGAPPWILELREQNVAIFHRLGLILQKEDAIMDEINKALDEAEAAAARNDQADSSAEGLLNKLVDLIAALKTGQTDPATAQRITNLATALSDRAARLGVAVQAATPADVS